jgi:hypothetical protein
LWKDFIPLIFCLFGLVWLVWLTFMSEGYKQSPPRNNEYFWSLLGNMVLYS